MTESQRLVVTGCDGYNGELGYKSSFLCLRTSTEEEENVALTLAWLVLSPLPPFAEPSLP